MDRVDERLKNDAETVYSEVRRELGVNFSTVAFAKWLGVSRNVPVDWIRTGKLRAMQPTRKFIINAHDAADFLARAYEASDSMVLRV
jgi:predicted site-specific integrase-resolvase